MTTEGDDSVTGRIRKARKIERKRARQARGFGRHLPWVPEDLPDAALCCWPRKDDWPTSTDVHRFIDDTDARPDARLAVLTGLRRWAEPASSQLLLTVAAIIVSIVAGVLAVSDFGVLFRVGIVAAGMTYIVVAVFAIHFASVMDQRRKVAHVWLRAFEDGLTAAAARATATEPGGPPGSRSWWDRILA